MLSLLLLLSLLVPGVLEFSTEVWSFPPTCKRRVRAGYRRRENHCFLTSCTLSSIFCSRSRSPTLAPAPGKSCGARQPSRAAACSLPILEKAVPRGKAASSLPSTCRGTVASAHRPSPRQLRTAPAAAPGSPGLPGVAGAGEPGVAASPTVRRGQRPLPSARRPGRRRLLGGQLLRGTRNGNWK